MDSLTFCTGGEFSRAIALHKVSFGVVDADHMQQIDAPECLPAGSTSGLRHPNIDRNVAVHKVLLRPGTYR